MHFVPTFFWLFVIPPILAIRPGVYSGEAMFDYLAVSVALEIHPNREFDLSLRMNQEYNKTSLTCWNSSVVEPIPGVMEVSISLPNCIFIHVFHHDYPDPLVRFVQRSPSEIAAFLPGNLSLPLIGISGVLPLSPRSTTPSGLFQGTLADQKIDMAIIVKPDKKYADISFSIVNFKGMNSAAIRCHNVPLVESYIANDANACYKSLTDFFASVLKSEIPPMQLHALGTDRLQVSGIYEDLHFELDLVDSNPPPMTESDFSKIILVEIDNGDSPRIGDNKQTMVFTVTFALLWSVVVLFF